MKNVRKILEEIFQKTDWIIEKPQEGWETTSFIASLGEEKYFIKLDTNKEIMKRLDTLTVAPKIVAAGDDYVIQEFITEPFINREWLVNNVSKLAKFFLLFHTDQQLLQIVKNSVSQDKRTIAGELENMQNKLQRLPKKYKDVENAIKQLEEKYKKFSVKLEPVHDDPNYKNIFLHNNKLLMIDWNNIRLSDPISDMGTFLWWYIPKNKWQDFFQAYGLDFNEDIIERIYLAAGKMSLSFTLWCIEHNVDYQISFRDFAAAINEQENPRAWYKK